MQEVGEGGIWRGRRLTGGSFYRRWGIDFFWGSLGFAERS
jgi:hypothetical protein